MQIKLNVFQKTRKTDAGVTFKTYSTKDKNGVYHQVRFTLECAGTEKLPKTKEPFVLVVDTKKVSKSIKKHDDGYELPLLYVKEILDVLPYEDEELNGDEFLPF